ISAFDLLCIGRIKGVLLLDGVAFYPDDFLATLPAVPCFLFFALAVPAFIAVSCLALLSFGGRGRPAEEVMLKLRSVKREVTSAISKSHSLRVADLVLVSPGSIPITTSGKIRRSACVERYRSDGFKRLDVAV
ncbi:acyl-CoA synthetase, partial [Pandoraea nosoerga]|nr:acyl-CoA synthetase [Pandoraea nosoerga]